jgi:hypothetical protein
MHSWDNWLKGLPACGCVQEGLSKRKGEYR